MIGMKAAAITGGIGVIAVLVVFVALTIEKNAHAVTKQALADEKSLVADIRTQQAVTAGERAQAIEAALREQQDELNRQLEDEQRLRLQLAEIEDQQRADRRASDARIERLKSENEELRQWADTGIPDDWIDFMREPADQAIADASP